MNRTNLMLLTLVVLLGGIPLLLPVAEHLDEPFAGADGQAEAAIVDTYPDYEPWFTSFWKPPSDEIESLLFSLQAALGAGLLGYYIGLRRGQSQGRGKDKPDAGD
jgi:cobalt/nickel transport protein